MDRREVPPSEEGTFPADKEPDLEDYEKLCIFRIFSQAENGEKDDSGEDDEDEVDDDGRDLYGNLLENDANETTPAPGSETNLLTERPSLIPQTEPFPFQLKLICIAPYSPILYTSSSTGTDDEGAECCLPQKEAQSFLHSLHEEIENFCHDLKDFVHVSYLREKNFRNNNVTLRYGSKFTCFFCFQSFSFFQIQFGLRV